MVLTNRVNAADMANTRVSLTFKQYYYDATTPAPVVMAKMTAGTETNWTSTSSTQDGYLALRVAQNGVVTERVRVTSGGSDLSGSGAMALSTADSVGSGSASLATGTTFDGDSGHAAGLAAHAAAAR